MKSFRFRRVSWNSWFADRFSFSLSTREQRFHSRSVWVNNAAFSGETLKRKRREKRKKSPKKMFSLRICQRTGEFRRNWKERTGVFFLLMPHMSRSSPLHVSIFPSTCLDLPLRASLPSTRSIHPRFLYMVLLWDFKGGLGVYLKKLFRLAKVETLGQLSMFKTFLSLKVARALLEHFFRWNFFSVH